MLLPCTLLQAGFCHLCSCWSYYSMLCFYCTQLLASELLMSWGSNGSSIGTEGTFVTRERWQRFSKSEIFLQYNFCYWSRSIIISLLFQYFYNSAARKSSSFNTNAVIQNYCYGRNLKLNTVLYTKYSTTCLNRELIKHCIFFHASL